MMGKKRGGGPLFSVVIVEMLKIFSGMDDQGGVMVALLVTEELFFPGAALAILIIVIGLFLMVDGLLMITAVGLMKERSQNFSLSERIIAVFAGVIIFLWPGINSIPFYPKRLLITKRRIFLN